LTKRWLDEEIAAQDARRASGEAAYVVTDGYRYVTDEAHADTTFDGQHWTSGRRDAHKNAVRMSWADARAVAKTLRGGGSKVSIVHLSDRVRREKQQKRREREALELARKIGEDVCHLPILLWTREERDAARAWIAMVEDEGPWLPPPHVLEAIDMGREVRRAYKRWGGAGGMRVSAFLPPGSRVRTLFAAEEERQHALGKHVHGMRDR
jgi:hypothetical protein